MVEYIERNWIAFYVECFNRMLFVHVSEKNLERAERILVKRYEEWVENTLPEVHDACCEEYMLEGLKELGIEFDVEYGSEEE